MFCDEGGEALEQLPREAHHQECSKLGWMGL